MATDALTSAQVNFAAVPAPPGEETGGEGERRPFPLRRIWLCADDYGISPAVNAAIRTLIVRGRLNATSVMVSAPTFDRSEAVSLSILNAGTPRVAIGLHFTMTAPFQPLSQGYAPVRDGAFLPLANTLRAAWLRRLTPEKIAIEVFTQIKAFITAFNQPPDFVDGHQHVQLFPQIRDAILKAMMEMAPKAWARQCGCLKPAGGRLADRKGLLLDYLSRGFRRRARKFGISTNPSFAGTYDFDSTADYAALFADFLKGLPGGSVVMCHPGFVDAELVRLDPLTTQRQREYAFFASEAFPPLLENHGLTLT